MQIHLNILKNKKKWIEVYLKLSSFMSLMFIKSMVAICKKIEKFFTVAELSKFYEFRSTKNEVFRKHRSANNKHPLFACCKLNSMLYDLSC